MESYNNSSSRPKPKRIALGEVSNTQKSKESAKKPLLQSDTRDSDSSKEVVNSSSTVSEKSEKDTNTQQTVIFNGTREINIPTPRKVTSPTKVTWYYPSSLPRVVIPIVTPPEVTVNKPNFETMKSNETTKKNSKRSKSNTKKSQSNNNTSLLNWFSPTTSSNDQKSGSDKSQNDTSLPNTSNGNQNSNILKENSNSTNIPRQIANISKKRPREFDESDPTFNAFVTPLPVLENVDLGAIDMNLIVDILRLYDFIIKFEKPMELNLEYNGNKLTYVHLEEMILDNRLHTRLAFLQSDLLTFLYKESEEECDIDLVNLQYYLTERYPNKKFLREKEYSEFSPRERMSIFIDLMNEALRTNKLHEFIRELLSSPSHKKENDIRTERMKNIKFEVNESRVRIINKENEIKDIEKQSKEITISVESEIDLPNAVTKRQKAVAKRKAKQEALNELNERRKVAEDEIEQLLHKLDKLDMEHKELNMLNRTGKDHANCILRGGSILNPSGRDERFYMIVKLGQDRDGRYYWFFRALGGVFVETVKWNYPEQDSDNSSVPLTSSSEWQFINGIGVLRMIMTVLNTRVNREKFLKTNLKILEKEIEPTFDRLNSWLEKKRDIIKAEQKMEIDSEEVKSIMSQHHKSFWKLFDTVNRKKNVWSLEEYYIIMEEYVKRKIEEFERILQHVDPNLVFKDSQSNLGTNINDLVNKVKNMISETGIKFTNRNGSKTTSSKKDKNWGWLYNAASDWYLLDIKTYSTLAAWLDVVVEAGEPVVRSIKKRMQEQLTEKLKCSTRLRNKKYKVEYKEESIDETEEDDDEEQKVPSKWSFRERKKVTYK